MNTPQQKYLLGMYRTYDESPSTYPRSNPMRLPWLDALDAVVEYLNGISKHGEVHRASGFSDILAWGPGYPWRAGVFEADNYDNPSSRGWYWRLPEESFESSRHTTNPARAVIDAVNTYEKQVGADPSAPGLDFHVLLNFCGTGNHTWKQTSVGLHGWEKGTRFYTCTVCGEKKEEG